MQNWFAIETESEYRRLEQEHIAAVEARSAMASMGPVKSRHWLLPHLSAAGLKLKLTRLGMLVASLARGITSRPTAACEASPGD